MWKTRRRCARPFVGRRGTACCARHSSLARSQPSASIDLRDLRSAAACADVLHVPACRDMRARRPRRKSGGSFAPALHMSRISGRGEWLCACQADRRAWHAMPLQSRFAWRRWSSIASASERRRQDGGATTRGFRRRCGPRRGRGFLRARRARRLAPRAAVGVTIRSRARPSRTPPA